LSAAETWRKPSIPGLVHGLTFGIPHLKLKRAEACARQDSALGYWRTITLAAEDYMKW